MRAEPLLRAPSDPILTPRLPINAAQANHIYQNLLRQWRIAQRFARPDWSIVDLWVARHLLSWGLLPNQVKDILRLGSPAVP